MNPQNDGLDYIYYGSLAFLASGLLTLLGSLTVRAGGAVVSTVLHMLSVFALLGFAGLWYYGFTLHRQHVRTYLAKR
ncbi:MAG: hypothetical protein QW614_00985 [Candidatus Caldarchaeum sp.]|uniref:Uncharacterized protein n=1 Tax=Caldiarchaeum subterraneum TaxID=311458 RepID=A0A7C5Q8V7_CALS0